MTLFAKVLIPFVIVCLPEITELVEPEVSRNNERIVTNSSNTSTACHFHILESSLESVLKLMQNSKTNAIKLNIWIESVNDTMTPMNKNRVPTDMVWVNEVGRTLYSLILETRWYIWSLISYLPGATLTAGFRDVSIVVSEENERCLLSTNNTMDHTIFDVLLLQLYRISDVKTDYQFCRTHNLALNCCRIFPGDKNIRICSYYSSLVPHFYPIITVTVFALYLAFPLMVDYLSGFKENDHYTISNSPMALSYIFYMIFIEGQGPVKSVGRKLLIVTFVLVICLPVRNFHPGNQTFIAWLFLWYYFLGCWTLIFMASDIYGFNVFQESDFGLKGIGDSPLEIITYPFNLTLLWKNVSEKWPLFYNNLRLDLNPTTECIELSNLNKESSQMITEQGHANGDDEEYSPPHCRPKTLRHYFGICKYRISIFILIILYLGIAFPLSCVLTVSYFFICIWKFYKRAESRVKHVFCFIYGVSVFGLLMYCSIHLFGAMVLFIIGLFLNGETYINYFLPLSTILFYSWTNWKSSVETKYLVLSTSIYEVCKDSTPVVQSTTLANSGEEIGESATPVESGVERDAEGEEIGESATPVESGVERDAEGEEIGESATPVESGVERDAETGNPIFVIKLNDNGEPIIPTELYHLVRKKFLSYHRVLFYYFMGIFFVIVFAYFLYTMMSLSDKSGITSTVQIIGSMAATALPIIFNLVWKKNSDEQKEANAIALKSKLKRVLKIHSSNETTGEIKVELKIKQPNTQNVACTRV